MSCPSTVDYINGNISIFGGLPTSSDVAPSALFIALYVILAPLGLYRAFSRHTRTWILLRPNLFIGARIATFIIRLVQAKCNVSVGSFIAELILEISGFNIICEPLVRLLEQNLHASAYNNGIQEPVLIVKVLKLMRLGLLASLILGIYTGTQYGSDMTLSEVQTLDTYRLATSGLNVGIVGLAVVFSIILHKPYRCDTRATAFVLAVGCMLIIPSAYRLNAVVNALPNLGTKTKVEFWVLGATFEWLATAAFVIANLRQLFDLDYKHPDNGGGPIGALVTGIRGAIGHPSNHVNAPPKYVTPEQPVQQQGYAVDYQGAQEETDVEKK